MKIDTMGPKGLICDRNTNVTKKRRTYHVRRVRMRAARKQKCGSQLGHNVNLQVLRVNVEETESAGAS